MYTRFKKYSWFLIPYIILFIFVLVVLLFYDKKAVHLWSCVHSSSFFDVFFKWITNLGDGFFILALAFVLLFYRIGSGLFVAATYALSGLIAQIIKHIAKAPRPLAVFGDNGQLHIVKGVEMLTANSFPSGHSASAFALCLTLAILSKYKPMQVVFLIFALLIAYSRVYLSQHFLIDALTGSFIGVVSVFIYLRLHEQIQKSWMTKPLYHLWVKH